MRRGDLVTVYFLPGRRCGRDPDALVRLITSRIVVFLATATLEWVIRVARARMEQTPDDDAAG